MWKKASFSCRKPTGAVAENRFFLLECAILFGNAQILTLLKIESLISRLEQLESSQNVWRSREAGRTGAGPGVEHLPARSSPALGSTRLSLHSLYSSTILPFAIFLPALFKLDTQNSPKVVERLRSKTSERFGFQLW